MGDSHTMGQGVAYDATFCSILGRRLSSHFEPLGVQVEVVNAGIWGYSSYQGLIVYEKFVRAWHGDLHIVAYGTNDHQPLARAGTRFKDRLLYTRPGSKPEPIMAELAADWEPHILRAARYGIRLLSKWYDDRRRQRGSGEEAYSLSERRATPEEYAENITMLLRAIRDDGSTAVVLGIAINEPEYRDALRRAAVERGVAFLATWMVLTESEPAVRAGKLYSGDREMIERWFTPDAYAPQGAASRFVTIDGGHPNQIGHKIIAESLVEAVMGDHRLTAVPRHEPRRTAPIDHQTDR
jgi:lysophospholipase L1-like esterase